MEITYHKVTTGCKSTAERFVKHTPNHNLRTKTLLANNVLKDVDAKHFKSTFSAVKYRVYQLNKSESFKVCYFYTVIVLSSSIDFTAAVAQRARVCASKGSERLGVLFQAVTDLSKKTSRCTSSWR